MVPKPMRGQPAFTAMQLPGQTPQELALTFAGNIVKHLGVQMYAGRPVPAIAELISNAWDADATDVQVELPLDEDWDPSKTDQVIKVSDNGNGMTWGMVRDAYLDVGRDRREAEGTDTSPGGRRIQGRKGVGKLAGFGVADTLEVQTIHKNGHPGISGKALIWFRLDLADLKKAQRGPAPVRLLFAGPVNKAPAGARRSHGTTIILRSLHERRIQNSDRFHHSMAQRFLFLGPKFRVRINREDLRAEDIKLQWRWPSKGWETAEVTGCGPVRYWIGFTSTPRKQNEGELSGILIYTREKISQEATFFDISGGVTGQHGLRYLVGMVKVEWLDAGVGAPDLIATHRGSIAWESPQGAAFQDWGQHLIRKYLSKWARLRTALREHQIKQVSPTLAARVGRLSPSYRDVAIQFIEKFKSVEMEPGEFEDILSWFLDALENATLRNILQKLREADSSDLGQLDDLLSKMEIRTAVALLQIVDSNLAAIETLEKMHRRNAKERGIISKHLEGNPWLIDPTWILNRTEARVSTWLKDEFGMDSKPGKSNADRVDFFCVGVGGTLHIVEIKRGGHTANERDIHQADKYREYVTNRFREISDPKAIKYAHVQSHLVAARLHQNAGNLKQAYADKGWVMFTTWDDLIERAKQSHHRFREILQIKVSEPDEAELIDGPAKGRVRQISKAGKGLPKKIARRRKSARK